MSNISKETSAKCLVMESTTTIRKRFDSLSTNYSSSEISAHHDLRFEPRQVPDVLVKKSFLSSQSSNKLNSKNTTSMGSSSLSFRTTHNNSCLSVPQMSYQIILSIQTGEKDTSCDYRCFPEVEMVLDDDLTVESVTHDVIDKLNLKMRGELKQRYKSNKNHIPRELLHKINSSQESFEMCQANKNGQPKGCSFDRNQILRSIKSKTRLCLKVLDSSAYNPIIFKLMNKQTQQPPKKYDFGVYPIQEQDDDLTSIPKTTSHYKGNLIRREMDNDQSNNSPYQQSHLYLNENSTCQQEDTIASPLQNPNSIKRFFWNHILKCGVLCQ